MLSWAFEPAEQGMLEELVERGRADARAWARASGLDVLAAAEAAAAAAAGERQVQAVPTQAAAAVVGGRIVLP